MRRIGLLFGLLSAATVATADQPQVPRDLTETAEPSAWLPGNSGANGTVIRIRRGLIHKAPAPAVASASTPNYAERALARIERDRALRLLRAANRRDVIIIVRDKRPHPPAVANEPEPTVQFRQTTR